MPEGAKRRFSDLHRIKFAQNNIQKLEQWNELKGRLFDSLALASSIKYFDVLLLFLQQG